VPPIHLFKEHFQDNSKLREKNENTDKTNQRNVILKDQKSSRFNHSAFAMLTRRQYDKQNLSKLKSPVLPKILVKNPSNLSNTRIINIPSNINNTRHQTELGNYQCILTRNHKTISNATLLDTSSRGFLMVPQIN